MLLPFFAQVLKDLKYGMKTLFENSQGWEKEFPSRILTLQEEPTVRQVKTMGKFTEVSSRRT